MNRTPTLSLGIGGVCLLCTGCGRAPAIDVIGSFFPAWMVCLIISIVHRIGVARASSAAVSLSRRSSRSHFSTLPSFFFSVACCGSSSTAKEGVWIPPLKLRIAERIGRWVLIGVVVAAAIAAAAGRLSDQLSPSHRRRQRMGQLHRDRSRGHRLAGQSFRSRTMPS